MHRVRAAIVFGGVFQHRTGRHGPRDWELHRAVTDRRAVSQGDFTLAGRKAPLPRGGGLAGKGCSGRALSRERGDLARDKLHSAYWLDYVLIRLSSAGTGFPTCLLLVLLGKIRPVFRTFDRTGAVYRRGHAQVPVELPRLGGRADPYAACGDGGGACACGQEQSRGHLRAQRSLREAARTDEDMFTIPTSLCH